MLIKEKMEYDGREQMWNEEKVCDGKKPNLRTVLSCLNSAKNNRSET